MMKKKVMSLLLALVMCVGLTVPAVAADSAYKVDTVDGPITFLTAAERSAEREKIAQSIKQAGGTVLTQQETPTDSYCQERLQAMEKILKDGGTVMLQQETSTKLSPASSYYVPIPENGAPIFTPEQNKGAHYYAFSPYSTAYTESFVNVKLPTEFNNANRRNGYLCVGLYGALGGVDLGLRNVGTGWMPYYWDTVGKVGGEYSNYTAPATATNAKICARVVNETTVYLFIQFLNSSGNPVGQYFEENLEIGSGNFTFSGGRARCRHFRFAALVPKAGVAENREDGSYMRGAQFTNCQLYNGSAYESWGILSDRVAVAWKVYAENIALSWTTYNDAFNMNHT